MIFKKGDVVFVSEEGMKKMCIPLSNGSIFTLHTRKDTRHKPYWIMTNNYIVLECYLTYSTDLIKALV